MTDGWKPANASTEGLQWVDPGRPEDTPEDERELSSPTVPLQPGQASNVRLESWSGEPGSRYKIVTEFYAPGKRKWYAPWLHHPPELLYSHEEEVE